MSAPTATASRRIDAAPADVAAALTDAHDLGSWLCDEARSERREDGAVLLRWIDGATWTGRWSAWSPPDSLALALRDLAGDGAAALSIALSPEAGGTRVDVSATGLGDEAAWQQRLDDLEAWATLGEQARLARRPFLGVVPAFDGDMESEVRLSAVVPEGSAAKAGIRGGDRLVRVGEQPLGGWSSLGGALAGHVAGDAVAVHVLRDGAEHVFPVTLGSRPPAKAPLAPDVTAAWLHDAHEAIVAKLEAALDGVTAAEADARPAEGEWSIRQVLGHLIVSERYAQASLQNRCAGEPEAGWPDSPDTPLQRVLARQPLAALQAQLIAHLRETDALSQQLLEGARPPLARYIARSAEFTGEHVDDHLGQIAANLAAARVKAA